jgi:hypothetical protein
LIFEIKKKGEFPPFLYFAYFYGAIVGPQWNSSQPRVSATISAVVQPEATAPTQQLVVMETKKISSGLQYLIVVSMFSEMEVSAAANPEIRKQPKISFFIIILFR